VPGEQFAEELLNDIDPFVEKNYRIMTGQENRAIAGLSMGGGHAIVAMFRNPDRFGYAGIWSSGFGPQLNADMEKRSPEFFEADKTNKLVRLIWIGVGKADPLAYDSAKNLTELLNSHGIKNEYHESDGGHTWINWRQYLNQYAQLLFK
jgi:enterochelin esterase family protein